MDESSSNAPQPASLITFYSYKGGVGRSMAVANLAVILAQRGHRVLAVDWDLEAPGLDRYFANSDVVNPKVRGGLLKLLENIRDGRSYLLAEFYHRVTL